MSSPPPLSPECRLVFRSADPASRPAEYAALAAAVRDWERVLIIAEREAATTSLARTLRDVGDGVPADIAQRVRMSAAMTELRMQYLSRRLQGTAAVLADRNVPFLLLKGAAVGAMVDPTFRSRPMNDVDVLVRREDVARARDAIVESGWPMTTDPDLLERLAEHHHLPHFVDPRMAGIRLELHVSLLPANQPFSFDEALLWREARPASAPFAGALLPSPEHLLLHAAIHFAWQHSMQFGAWRTFRSATAATGARDFDWDRFVALALETKAATACYWTLRLAERLGGIVAPGGVLNRVAPPTPELVRAALERHFIASIAVGEAPPSPSVQLSRWLWRAALRPKWSGHQQPGAFDADIRDGPRMSRRERVARHMRGYHHWASYLLKTLLR